MNLPTIAYAFVIFLACVVVVTGLLRMRSKVAERWPFFVKPAMTEPEQVLFHRLVRALPGHLVLAQVHVSRVLGVRKGSDAFEWNKRIAWMSYDYVVCREDATPVAVIELDDKSHSGKQRMAADARKNKATADAGLALIRWNVRAIPTEAEIQQAIERIASAEPNTTAEVVARQQGPTLTLV